MNKVKAHNKTVDDNVQEHAGHYHHAHLKPETALVIGSEVCRLVKVIHLNITTPHMLLHVFCSLESGWSITLSGDGIYSLCKNQFGMVILCIIGLHSKSFSLCYSVVPEESISA